MAEGIGVSDDAAHGAFGIEPRKVVAAEVVLVDVVGQHVPGCCENRMLNGDNGFGLTKSGRESSVTCTKLGVVLGAGCGHGGGAQGSAQPPVAVTGLARFAFPGGLVMSGADAGPGGQMPGGAEAAHVGAGLGDDDLGDGLADAGDGLELVALAGNGTCSNRDDNSGSVRTTGRSVAGAARHRKA